MKSQFVAQENARRNQDRYFLAAETVLKSTYIDESIDRVENHDKGVEIDIPLVEDIMSPDNSKEQSGATEPDDSTQTGTNGCDFGPALNTVVADGLRSTIPVRDVYSDNTDVLWWIRGRGKDFQPFIANRIDWLTDDFIKRSKMKVPDGPSEMPETRYSKRKEDINAHATLMTCKLQKGTASKQSNTLKEWRLDPKRFSSWTRFVRVHARVRGVLQNMRNRDNRNEKTQVVHLEMAWGLDTDTLSNAFGRFTSHRGVPKEVTSDRGTNFVGAVGELKKLVRQLDRKHLQTKTFQLGEIGRFNPSAAPHFGGAYEVTVKAAKKATYAVVGERDVNDEKLITVFAGVESLLNSRLLTYHETMSH
ncbi:hypothetical protein AWC38_SpisGene7969 [Stylophora pistillata]|uniref:Integrase catalytic domain-containing protein n=1 Tax=Stylophora pistillata TaxID=50429 RepID=A0A2B4SDA4_STYPI|nr:hypothetical protein AWC38_SpisGene7969 [Stylophora pistillata]